MNMFQHEVNWELCANISILGTYHKQTNHFKAHKVNYICNKRHVDDINSISTVVYVYNFVQTMKQNVFTKNIFSVGLFSYN